MIELNDLYRQENSILILNIFTCSLISKFKKYNFTLNLLNRLRYHELRAHEIMRIIGIRICCIKSR